MFFRTLLNFSTETTHTHTHTLLQPCRDCSKKGIGPTCFSARRGWASEGVKQWSSTQQSDVLLVLVHRISRKNRSMRKLVWRQRRRGSNRKWITVLGSTRFLRPDEKQNKKRSQARETLQLLLVVPHCYPSFSLPSLASFVEKQTINLQNFRSCRLTCHVSRRLFITTQHNTKDFLPSIDSQKSFLVLSNNHISNQGPPSDIPSFYPPASKAQANNMNTIASSTSSNTALPSSGPKSAWTFTSHASMMMMEDVGESSSSPSSSPARQVLDKWTTSSSAAATSLDIVDADDLMMIDDDGCDDDCLPGIVSESESSESESSSHHSSSHDTFDDSVDDIDLMMNLDDEDGLLMDDLLFSSDDDVEDELKLLENVLNCTSNSDEINADDMILPMSALSKSTSAINNTGDGCSDNSMLAPAATDAFFAPGVLASSSAATTSQSVLDERLLRLQKKLQESMRRSSETRQSLYARSAALSNYRRTQSVRQVLTNVEYTSKGVARSFSDPTPLSHMQHTLLR